MARIELTKIICTSLSQRYLIAVMCMNGILLSTTNQHTFVILMDEMVYDIKGNLKHHACPVSTHPEHPSSQHNDSSGLEEFHWGSHLQVYLLMGYPFGLFLGKLPAGLATDKFGAKTLFGYSVFVPAMLSAMTPISARTSPYAMLGNRIFNGLLTTAQPSSIAYLAARWFPENDIAIMLTIMYLGYPLGALFSYVLSHLVVHVYKQWTTVYYINGLLGVLFGYVWQAFIWEDPFENPHISKKELDLLADTVPMFATDSEHEYMAIFLYLLMSAIMFAAGFAATKLTRRRSFQPTTIIKTYFIISVVVGSLAMLGVTFVECNRTAMFFYFICGVACLGVGFTTCMYAVVCIAPNFVGVVSALTIMPAMISLPLQLQIMDMFTQQGSLIQWRVVIFTITAVCIFLAGIFLKWGNCRTQPWNEPVKKTHIKVDYDTELYNRNEPPSKTDIRRKENVGDQPSVPLMQPTPLVNEQSSASRVLGSAEPSAQSSRGADGTGENSVATASSQALGLSQPASSSRVDQIKSARSLNQMKKSRSTFSSRN